MLQIALDIVERIGFSYGRRVFDMDTYGEAILLRVRQIANLLAAQTGRLECIALASNEQQACNKKRESCHKAVLNHLIHHFFHKAIIFI